MGSTVAHDRLVGFDLVQTNYKQVGDHAIRTDFIIPQSEFTGKRPVIVRFHGGGLVTGDSLFMEWFPQWMLDLAKKHNAVIASPNYRLMPEATSLDVFEDVEDFWTWLHSPALAKFLSSSAGTELDLTRILTAGESAGGLLSICLALAHPDEIRAATAGFPCVDMASSHFTTANPTPLPDIPPSTVSDFLARMDPTAIRSLAIPPDRLDLMVAAIHYGSLGQLYDRGTESSPSRELRYPFEKLDQPDVKIPRGGIAIRHGLQDFVVPAEGSEKFVAKASKVMKGKPGGDKIFLALREGEHGFDNETPLEEEWLQDNLKEAVSTWLE